MKRFDRLDLCYLLGAAFCVLLIGALLGGSPAEGDERSGPASARLEQKLAAQARARMLQQLYEPVERLRAEGQYAMALLELAQLQRSYPGEPYGELLRGELLLLSGARDEAVAALSLAVKGNGDFIDDNSPLSKRSLVADLVSRGLPLYAELARAGNASARGSLQALRFLQSRLAGGCE